MTISIKTPNKEWVHSYLTEGLTSTEAYQIDTPRVELKLDQNESPFDWPQSLKDKVCEELKTISWNRYPPCYSKELEALVADYAGVPHDSVILSPGSNHLVALTLSLFGRNASKVIVARPSFALYESHLRYENIPYEAWELDDDLEFNLDKLPEITNNSLVVFASPNNPVGNVLSIDTFSELLNKYPDSLFIADEAYFEFAEYPYTPLLEKHGNLILLRTFSKTLGAAGIRIGYAIAAPTYLKQVRKVMLPYLLNRFSLVAATSVLKNQEILKGFIDTVNMIKSERDQLAEFFESYATQQNFQVIKSEANFLLLRWKQNENAMRAYQTLIDGGILVRNVSKGPGLNGCLRITIGNMEENQKVKAIIETIWKD